MMMYSSLDQNSSSTNLLKITALLLKKAPNPQIPKSPSTFYENETALPLIRGEKKAKNSAKNKIINLSIPKADAGSPLLGIICQNLVIIIGCLH